MGRRKINIELIQDERNRQVTFNKRKTGLMKKAMELAVLCNCRIGLIMFDGNGKLYDFRTEDMSSLVTNYFSQEVFESNDKDSLFRRYNGETKKGHLASGSNLDIPDELKFESFFEETDKTDETTVDVESNSDGNASHDHEASPTAGQAASKRRKTCANSPKREYGVKRHQTTKFASPNPGNGWSTFAARPAFVSESAFQNATTQQRPTRCTSYDEEHFKEPLSAAQQQILRLEDTPSFMMSIPRPSNESMYGMPPNHPMSGGAAHPPSMYQPNAVAGSHPMYLLDDTNARKILDGREALKNSTVPAPLMSLPRMTSLPSMHTRDEMHPVPSQTPFPSLDGMNDLGLSHVNSVPSQYSLGHGLPPQSLHDLQHETMILQSLLHPGPSYNFPSSSHNSAA